MFKKLVVIFAALAAVSSYSTVDRRIVGGNSVALGQVPSIASLRNLHSTQHFAAGVMISNTWLISSAFYLVGRGHHTLHIVFGIVDLASTGALRQSSQIVIHQHYDLRTRENDIACVQFAHLGYTGNINRAFMYDYRITDTIGAQISGWGALTPEGGANSPSLRRLTVQTQASCMPTAVDGNFVIDNNSHICAQGATGTGICTSDIGGPLISADGLIGIASWNRNLCASQPDVYLRISAYRNWIRSITGV